MGGMGGGQGEGRGVRRDRWEDRAECGREQRKKGEGLFEGLVDTEEEALLSKYPSSNVSMTSSKKGVWSEAISTGFIIEKK